MDIELYLSNAKFAASAGNVEEARNLLKQVLDQDPRNVRAWILLADTVSSSKQAVLYLERALKLEPENETARHKLALYKLDEKAEQSQNGEEEWFISDFDEPMREQTPQEAWSYDAYTAKKQAAEAALRAELPQPKKLHFGWGTVLIATLSMTALCMLGLLLIPGISLFNFGNASAQQASAGEDVTDVIIQNIIASNNEDFDGYMRTIHSQSPAYATTAQMLNQIFGDFDLNYQISEIEVIKQTAQEAQVNFVLTTRKVHGPQFQDNQVSGKMILRKDAGVWKIYDQKIENVQYLD